MAFLKYVTFLNDKVFNTNILINWIQHTKKNLGNITHKEQDSCCCYPSQIPKDTVLHIWKGLPASYAAELSAITKAGYRVLLAAPWYINHISYGQDWRNYYTVQPLNFSGVCWPSNITK